MPMTAQVCTIDEGFKGYSVRSILFSVNEGKRYHSLHHYKYKYEMDSFVKGYQAGTSERRKRCGERVETPTFDMGSVRDRKGERLAYSSGYYCALDPNVVGILYGKIYSTAKIPYH